MFQTVEKTKLIFLKQTDNQVLIADHYFSVEIGTFEK